MSETIHHRLCPLCEACCGLELKVSEDKVISIRGHEANVFSTGYICPKGVALKDLHEDPDRLRMPLIKRGKYARTTAGCTTCPCWPKARALHRAGSSRRRAAQRPGANLNDLLDENWRDPLSGNAVLSGVAVELAPA
jgi:hypothetical protein